MEGRVIPRDAVYGNGRFKESLAAMGQWDRGDGWALGHGG